ncbi:MAG: ATP-dependent DNA helicase RecG, partial [Gammaproteobacteria bacterium]|nr:ATP-dependent DNA helicase RecG [Gammaproteobacteria bacterium]
IEGEILDSRIIPARRRMLVCQISDGEAVISLRFFNFYPNQQRQLLAGRQIRCFGEIRAGQRGYEIIHPEYQMIEPDSALESSVLTAVYPTTEGIGQASLRRWIQTALNFTLHEQIPNLINPERLSHFKLPSIQLMDAIRLLHMPPADNDIEVLNEGKHPAQYRLIVEELIAHQISMLSLKKQHQAQSARPFQIKTEFVQPLLASLPFKPTNAQKRVYKEICDDLSRPQPTMRLVQGDVGSGKTLVAILCALQVLNQETQVALMAPTELLSEQHYKGFKSHLEPLGIQVVWLTSKLKAKEKREALAQIRNNPAAMVVGTHALFQDQVEFANLGLLIIDEQHRFGVHQRLSLKEKGTTKEQHPHQIVMTATPIPRTLAMSAYADLDTSIIDELPPGRTPVKTIAMPDDRRDDLIQRLHHSCQEEQRQVYWVCTLIEESESLQCQAAEETYKQLQQELPNLTIGLVHGRMKSTEKSTVMAEFKAAKIDILVATTVIEVGVDVPNASLMVIDNAERLGLAQLHQLRGRVGRGSKDSHCVLLYKQPVSYYAEQRLAIMRDSNDGFIIAEKDLELRGPGEVLGTRQTGVAEFRIADIYRDRELLPSISKVAQALVVAEHPHNEALVRRWLGERDQYGKV